MHSRICQFPQKSKHTEPFTRLSWKAQKVTIRYTGVAGAEVQNHRGDFFFDGRFLGGEVFSGYGGFLLMDLVMLTPPKIIGFLRGVVIPLILPNVP